MTLRKLQLLLVLFMSSLAYGQYTTVTATVTDSNGQPYTHCTGAAIWIDQNATLGHMSTLFGSSFQKKIPIAACDGFGHFQMVLADNQQIGPRPSQWQFSICNGTGTPCFTKMLTITGATQDIGSSLSSAASPLSEGADASTLDGHTWASPGSIGSTTPNTATFTSLNTTARGTFSDSQMFDLNLSAINNCNSLTEYQSGQGRYFAAEGVVGCTAIPSSSHSEIGTGGSFYVNSLAGNNSSLGPGLPVAVYTQARCLADGCWGWGANFVYEDDGNRNTKIWAHGLEIDMGQQSTATAYTGGSVGIEGIILNYGGNGAGNVNTSIGYGATGVNGKHWGYGFFTGNGGALTGMQLGALQQSGTSGSQPLKFFAFNAGTGITSTIQETSAGDIGINPASAGRYLIVNGNLELAGTRTLNPTGGGTACASDATASYVLKCSYNGDTMSQVARLGAAQTWSGTQSFKDGDLVLAGSSSGSSTIHAPSSGGVSNTLPTTPGTLAVVIASGTQAMPTGAIDSLSCAGSVTSAATGVTTSDTITLSEPSSPPGSNGLLNLRYWVSPGAVNFTWCNPTANSQTPMPETIHWKVIR